VEVKLALHEPLPRWLPDFRLGDEDAAAHVTLRHLLSHTSGIEGDLFGDAGRGEDRIARFVSMLGEQRQIHAPGAMFSYCNSGFVIAGRLIEVAGDMPWDKAMRRRIAKPMETPSFSTLPEQAMRYLTAIGHLGAPGALSVTPAAYLAQSNAPAGSMPMARARDVVSFARALMNNGEAPNGARILSPESVRAMHEMNIACPRHMNIDAIGLATFLWDWDGDGRFDTFGHDGSTIGQAAWLRYNPARGVAVALLTNGGNGKGLAHELITVIFSLHAGIKPKEPPKPVDGFSFDAASYLGRFTRGGASIEIVENGGHVLAVHRPTPGSELLQRSYNVVLQRVDGNLLVGTMPGFTQPMTYHFLDRDAGGAARYLHHGVRAHRREEA
jgi:CubicO group peptidase (beta-lactamase class C family)